MPPVGRSLFDYVVAEQQGRRTVYQVPFPFTALVRKIEQELGPDDRGSPLKRVLIPLNRSLQRHAEPSPSISPIPEPSSGWIASRRCAPAYPACSSKTGCFSAIRKRPRSSR